MSTTSLASGLPRARWIDGCPARSSASCAANASSSPAGIPIQAGRHDRRKRVPCSSAPGLSSVPDSRPRPFSSEKGGYFNRVWVASSVTSPNYPGVLFFGRHVNCTLFPTPVQFTHKSGAAPSHTPGLHRHGRSRVIRSSLASLRLARRRTPQPIFRFARTEPTPPHQPPHRLREPTRTVPPPVPQHHPPTAAALAEARRRPGLYERHPYYLSGGGARRGPATGSPHAARVPGAAKL